MHRILAPDHDLVNARVYLDPAERARERLFIYVRMIEHAAGEHLAVRADDIPLVGVVIPTGIGMFQGDMKSAVVAAAHLDVEYISLAGCETAGAIFHWLRLKFDGMERRQFGANGCLLWQ